MNRLNIVFLFGALCFMASSALTLPTEAPETGNDVTTSDAGHDVDDDYPITKVPNLSGGESGIIRRVGFNGTFHCKQITCPPGTETCKFNSKYSEDGKTAEVHYTCLDSKDAVLLEQTKNEPINLKPHFDFEDFLNHFPFFKFPFFY